VLGATDLIFQLAPVDYRWVFPPGPTCSETTSFLKTARGKTFFFFEKCWGGRLLPQNGWRNPAPGTQISAWKKLVLVPPGPFPEVVL